MSRLYAPLTAQVSSNSSEESQSTSVTGSIIFNRVLMPSLGPWLEVSQREGGRSHDSNHGTVDAEWFRADCLQVHLKGGKSHQVAALWDENAGRSRQPDHHHHNHECLCSKVKFLNKSYSIGLFRGFSMKLKIARIPGCMPKLHITYTWFLNTTHMSKLSKGQFPASLRGLSRWYKSWSNTCMRQLLMQTLRRGWGVEEPSCHGTLRVRTKQTICIKSLTIPSRRPSWRSGINLGWAISAWTQLLARTCPGPVLPPTWVQEAFRIILIYSLKNKSLAKKPP